MITKKDILADGQKGDYLCSLSKLTGKKVVDVLFYVSSFDRNTPVIKACDVLFEDGSKMGIEGEHDVPYITTYASYPQDNTDDDTLQALLDAEDSE